MAMKFTAELPLGVIEPPGEFQSPGAVREMAAALETAGIDAAFITDHPIPDSAWLHGFGHDALDPFAALAFLAAASEKLLLHTSIIVLPYRNPFLTAKGAATVQVLSGGRLILGVGVGYQKGEFDALGIDFSKRGALTDEALEAIRRAWMPAVLHMAGSNFTAAGNEARPVPDPAPPIWIGGSSPKALERAARWGDGWCPFYATPGMSAINAESGIRSIDHLRECIDRLNGHRAALGQNGPFDVVLGPRLRIRQANAETADRFLQGVQDLSAAGVTWATINLAHPSRAAYLELVEWLGCDVLPQANGF